MTTVTIPKKVTKGEELVVIPRKDYEEFLRFRKLRAFSKLDKDLQEAMIDVFEGRVSGPFNSVKGLRRALEE